MPDIARYKIQPTGIVVNANNDTKAKLPDNKAKLFCIFPRKSEQHFFTIETVVSEMAVSDVLDVRPGITDPASIRFRNENELMEKAENPEEYYINVIMQEKLKLYLEYVRNHSLWGDIGLILKTFWVIVTE